VTKKPRRVGEAKLALIGRGGRIRAGQLHITLAPKRWQFVGRWPGVLIM
jgi:hypothetical protein